MANLFTPEWDAEQDRPPFSWRRARLGRQVGSRQLGASLFELAPGSSSFPLHVHHRNEELAVVLAGRPTLRTLEGERELEPGEVLSWPAGPEGAHRLDNRGSEPARVLIVSTMLVPEFNEYPDSRKVWLRGSAPGAEGGSSLDLILSSAQPLTDYLHGEAQDSPGGPPGQ